MGERVAGEESYKFPGKGLGLPKVANPNPDILKLLIIANRENQQKSYTRYKLLQA